MDAPLAADGLCIRPYVAADTAEFVAAVRESMATVGAWMSWCREPYTTDDARSWFEQCAANLSAASAYDAGVFSAENGRFLGGIGINQLNRQQNFGNIGYWVRQSCQRQGIATRAVRAMAAHGFSTLKFTRLEIVAAVDNRPSRGVAEKAGAVFECIARNRIVLHGLPIAAAVYSLVPP